MSLEAMPMHGPGVRVKNDRQANSSLTSEERHLLFCLSRLLFLQTKEAKDRVELRGAIEKVFGSDVFDD